MKKLINKSLTLNPGPDIRESLNKISLPINTNVLNVNKVISLCFTFDISFFNDENLSSIIFNNFEPTSSLIWASWLNLSSIFCSNIFI